jgi:hypothetical protein
MDAATDSTMATAATGTWELLHAELGTTTGLWGNGGESTAGDVAAGSTGEPGTEDSGGIGAVKMCWADLSVRIQARDFALHLWHGVSREGRDPYAEGAAPERMQQGLQLQLTEFS